MFLSTSTPKVREIMRAIRGQPKRGLRVLSSTPHPGRVQDHQHRAVIQAVRRVDEARHLLDAQDRRQSAGRLRVWRVVEEITPLQGLHKEEPQRGDMQPHRAGRQLPRPQQVRLVAAQMRLIQPVWPTLEVPSESLHRIQIAANGGRSEVTALELLQHDVATMGHKTPPVTRTLPRGSRCGRASGRVGYESASQFSREYSRLFGAPPQRDIAHAARSRCRRRGRSPNGSEVHSLQNRSTPSIDHDRRSCLVDRRGLLGLQRGRR